MAPRFLQKLKSVDFYRKIPNDLTEATLSGAALSMAAAAIILMLVAAEFAAFLRVETTTSLVVDRSEHGELLRINFNVSFPALPCEYATLDVSDALGTKRLNLTKTVRKVPIDADLRRAGRAVDDAGPKPDPAYDAAHPGDHYVGANFSESLTADTFAPVLEAYDIVVVNFFAPWCHWCQRLAPTWEAATEAVHDKYPEDDGRVRFAKVDCVAEPDLCRRNQIAAFPSIRVFRHGSDDVVRGGHHEHEAYYGDRTTEALVALADGLAPTAGQPHRAVAGVGRTSKQPGCNFSGFVLVKKVPGTLHFAARAPGHSLDFLSMDLSHTVHSLFMGVRPSPRRRAALGRLHPLGLSDDWADKLAGQDFSAAARGATYEHYLQVVLTTVEPRGGAGAFDAYEYTAQSHAYDATDHAAAKFTYRLSPVQVVVTEQPKKLVRFLVSTCAVVGGVATVAGILDGAVYQANRIAKKMELGKHS